KTLKKFTVLIVDDEQGIRDYFVQAFGAEPGFEVLTAADPQSAFSIAEDRFIHVAFIDMQLGHSLQGGVLVSKFLADHRPSCRCFLLTQHPGTYPDQLFALLDPVRPLVHGALQKQDFTRTWSDIVIAMASRWLSQPMEVLGVGDVFKALVDKNVRGERVN